MLNHLPVLGVLFSALVLLVGLVFRSQAITRLAIAVLIVSALAGVPVFLSGEPAEEALEHTAGVSERVIEAHEDAARIAMIALDVLGLAALFGWLRYRRSDVGRGFDDSDDRHVRAQRFDGMDRAPRGPDPPSGAERCADGPGACGGGRRLTRECGSGHAAGASTCPSKVFSLR